MAEYVNTFDHKRIRVHKFLKTMYKASLKNEMYNGKPRFEVVPDDFTIPKGHTPIQQPTAQPELKKKERPVSLVDGVGEADEIPGETPSERYLRLKNIELAKNQPNK